MIDLLAVPAWVGFLVAAVAVLALPRRVGTAVAVALTALAAPWAALVPAGTGLAVAPFGFEQMVVRVDGLSRPVTALFGFVAAVNVLYGHATGADARQQAYTLAYMGAGVAAVLAGDCLTLLVAWELLAVASTLLVWHHGGAAVRVGFRYAVYHLAGGTSLVAGVALHYAATGTFVMAEGFTPGLPTTLAVGGVLLNAGAIGVHAWLTETYPVPHVAASVVLAGFTTKVAVCALARAVPDGATAVVWVGALMVLYGVAQATIQTDLRRLLSYHIVSQVGYMVVAVGLGTAAGLGGATAHLTAHVLYKDLLFMVAGAIIVRVGESSLKRLGGLGRRMPVTFGAVLVAALAISGVPPFSGFVSKGLVVKAAETAGGEALWWALLLGSVGTALSFAKFGYYAFVRAAPSGDPLPLAAPDAPYRAGCRRRPLPGVRSPARRVPRCDARRRRVVRALRAKRTGEDARDDGRGRRRLCRPARPALAGTRPGRRRPVDSPRHAHRRRERQRGRGRRPHRRRRGRRAVGLADRRRRQRGAAHPRHHDRALRTRREDGVRAPRRGPRRIPMINTSTPNSEPDYDRLVNHLVDRFGDDLRWVASFETTRYDYHVRYIRPDLTTELSSRDLDTVVHRSIALFRRPYVGEVYDHLGPVRTLVLEHERATAVHVYLSDTTGVIVKIRAGHEISVPSFTEECLDSLYTGGRPS